MKNRQKCRRVFALLCLLLSLQRPITATAAADPNVDFQQRCQSPGVLKCIGFDAAADLAPAVWPNPGLYPAGDGQNHGSWDSTIKASGGGSLMFTILGGTGANSAGQWRQDFGVNFGENSHFYVQFRQRFSPEMMTAAFGGGGWKQIIIHTKDFTCGNVELTTNNQSYRGFPQMYSQCGQDPFQPYVNGDYQLEQGDYTCPYNGTRTAQNCAFYASNSWMTFYYDIQIGTWGSPNSTIKAYVAYEGQPLKQFIHQPNHVLYTDNPPTLYNYLTLLPYDTGKNGQQHPTAYTWYDELIISTQPIAAPGATTGTPLPSPPSSLTVQ